MRFSRWRISALIAEQDWIRPAAAWQRDRKLRSCAGFSLRRALLFFTLVPGDPESGGVYILDRKEGVFYWLDFNDQKWGGYSSADYEALERTSV